MEITVRMDEDEFAEFMSFRTDKTRSKKEVVRLSNQMYHFADKVCLALEEAPSQPGGVRIADADHAAELLDMASEYLC